VFLHKGIPRQNKTAPALTFEPRFILDNPLDYREFAREYGVKIGHSRMADDNHNIVPIPGDYSE
jgi:hypothetical protein